MAGVNLKLDEANLTSTMSREFNAPLEKVWQAHADREAMAKWWGGRTHNNEVEEWDFKAGGKWKIVSSDGKDRFAFYGEFKEVVDQDHLTWTFSVEGFPGDPIVETMSLESLPGGRTRLSTNSVYPSLEVFKGMVENGMEAGAEETWDRLAELVEAA